MIQGLMILGCVLSFIAVVWRGLMLRLFCQWGLRGSSGSEKGVPGGVDIPPTPPVNGYNLTFTIHHSTFIKGLDP